MIERIQFITNDFTRPHWENAALACKGGIRWVQLRVKDTDDDTWKEIAEKTQDVCVRYGAKFIINDNVALAKTLLADGVHVGLTDMPLAHARALLGESFIIGGTANTLDDVRKHHQTSGDYVGLGPLRFTDTKKKLSPILDITGYQTIMDQLSSAKIDIPIIAIGGIQLSDIKPLMQTGIFGVAISSLVTSATDPEGMAAKLVQEISIHNYKSNAT